MSVPQTVIKKRLAVLLLLSLAVGIILIGRVFWIQFVRGDELKTRAQSQWTRDVAVEPTRGTIYDKNKKPLAISATVDTVMASLPDIKEIDKTVAQLADALKLDENKLKEKFVEAKKKGKSTIYVKRKITDEESDKVRKLDLKGIYFTKENKRFYPERNFASHILGFTGIDSQGLDGVELIYDKYLRGVSGRIVSETDALSRKLPFGVDQYIPPKEGLNLQLTIDKFIQHIAERELEKVVAEHKAKKGTIIVMDPRNGEILALANKPDYDPNNFNKVPQKLWRNIAVTDTYEPGSTFKIVTAAAGLEEGIVTPDSTFFDPGYIMVSGVKIRCWRHGGHGSQTFKQVVQNSCNPGFVKLGTELGKEKLVKYIKGFGFSEITGIDLPGEAKGILDTSRIGPVELATISFGQGISVTPIQLATALATIANGGKLVQPHVAKALLDKDGNIVHEFKYSPIRQVISRKTAQEMNDILESVVTEGTGSPGEIEGYRVGGKTGTAEKYVQGKYTASYLGFAPVNDPRLVSLVVVDEPSAGTIYGGQICGPVFQKVMGDSLNYLGIKPEIKDDDKADIQVKVPDIRNLAVSDAIKILSQKGFTSRVEGKGQIVKGQVPLPGTKLKQNSTVILKVSDSGKNKDSVIVPDLKGRTVKESLNILNAIGLKMDISGSGFATKQTPSPGTKVPLGTTVKVMYSKNGISE